MSDGNNNNHQNNNELKISQIKMRINRWIIITIMDVPIK